MKHLVCTTGVCTETLNRVDSGLLTGGIAFCRRVQQLRELISAAEQNGQQQQGQGQPFGADTYSPGGGGSDMDGDYMPDGTVKGRAAATRRERGQQQHQRGGSSPSGRAKQQQHHHQGNGELMWVREDLGVCSEEQSEQMMHDADQVRGGGREGGGGGGAA